MLIHMMRFSQMRLSSSNAGDVYYHGSSIFFENCIFTNNYASQNGGHIFLYYITTNREYEEFELLFETYNLLLLTIYLKYQIQSFYQRTHFSLLEQMGLNLISLIIQVISKILILLTIFMFFT